MVYRGFRQKYIKLQFDSFQSVACCRADDFKVIRKFLLKISKQKHECENVSGTLVDRRTKTLATICIPFCLANKDDTWFFFWESLCKYFGRNVTGFGVWEVRTQCNSIFIHSSLLLMNILNEADVSVKVIINIVIYSRRNTTY